MKDLATHQSLSSYPCCILLTPLNKYLARCQNLSIEEQYEVGVRYFDIRIRFKQKKVVSGHGLIKYKVDVTKILSQLNFLSLRDKEKIVLRIVYEDTFLFFKRSDKYLLELFEYFIRRFPHLTFTELVCKKNWRVLKSINPVLINELYYYKSGKIFSPLKEARKGNPLNWMKLKDNHYNMLDFIDLPKDSEYHSKQYFLKN